MRHVPNWRRWATLPRLLDPRTTAGAQLGLGDATCPSGADLRVRIGSRRQLALTGYGQRRPGSPAKVRGVLWLVQVV